MGFAIPRIQYENLDTTGDTTSGSGTISTIPDTSDLVVGMFVRGTGIPTGAKIGTIGASSVTLASSVLATATASTVTLAFGFEILFDYPPIEVAGEIISANATVSESLSGIRQTSINYTQGIRKLKFSHLSPAVYTLVDTFLRGWALLGEEFRYYDDQTLTTYVTCELDSLKVTPTKIAPRGVDTYSWEVPLDLRRAL